MSLVLPSNLPALQVLDLQSFAWQTVERQGSNQGILLVGRSLNILSRNRLPSCMHQVAACPSDRFAIVYQARVHPDARLRAGTYGALPGELPVSGAALMALCGALRPKDGAS